MTRFVVDCGVALRLAQSTGVPAPQHRLLAPTLLRSQVLAGLYAAAKRGDIDTDVASRHLDHIRSLRIRLLGDRVLQRLAWQIAARFDWPDTFRAEYVALTRLQADAFVTLDRELARTVEDVVPVATIDDILRG